MLSSLFFVNCKNISSSWLWQDWESPASQAKKQIKHLYSSIPFWNTAGKNYSLSHNIFPLDILSLLLCPYPHTHIYCPWNINNFDAEAWKNTFIWDLQRLCEWNLEFGGLGWWEQLRRGKASALAPCATLGDAQGDGFGWAPVAEPPAFPAEIGKFGRVEEGKYNQNAKEVADCSLLSVLRLCGKLEERWNDHGVKGTPGKMN